MSRPFLPHNEQRRAFHNQRNQARFRGEIWDPQFTFDVWWNLWQPYWHLRGRTPTDYNMLRKDVREGWSLDNVTICERGQYLWREGRYFRKGDHSARS